MSENKIVLLTGASSGIGKETARLLAQEGFKVYAASRHLDKMTELTQFGVEIISLDLTDEKSIESCVAQVLKKEKRIDILINNAGYGSFGALEVVPMEEAHRQFEVNLFGLASLIQKVLPKMREQRYGRIINISSIAAYFTEPNGAWYHASKAAVDKLSDCLRIELKPFGIDVVLIQPGMIDTGWQGIAEDSLLKTTSGTVYESSGQKHAQFLKRGYKLASKPVVVAKTIVKASMAKRPKIRYRTGKGARSVIFLMRVVPTRILDCFIGKLL